MAANKVIFQKSLKELRIILCQKSKSSQGVRDFIEKHYVHLKTANPEFPILIRECTNVEPKIFARYELGKELNVSMANQNSDVVFKKVVEFANKVY